jgi:hypothetical protein
LVILAELHQVLQVTALAEVVLVVLAQIVILEALTAAQVVMVKIFLPFLGRLLELLIKEQVAVVARTVVVVERQEMAVSQGKLQA